MAEAVFSKDLLRESILNYAVHSKDGKNVCRDTMCFIRLVQKSWLRTTTKLLQNSNQPLYLFTLNKNNSLNGTQFVKERGKLLDQFNNRMVIMPSTTDDTLPTFSLKILEECFRQENHGSISNCLTLFGGGLVELNIYVPTNGGSLNCVFPPFYFPVLEKLTVHLSATQLENMNEGETIADSSCNVTHLINSLLNGAPSLKEFVLPFRARWDILPSGFKYVTLPPSLTLLDINYELRTDTLNLLLKNPLLNLTRLNLLITNLPVADGVLLRVLENVRKTLKDLSLSGIRYKGPPQNVTFIRFPVMESLEILKMRSIHCELEPDLPPLENCLPKMTDLIFTNQTVENFRKLTEKSTFTSIEYLKLDLVNENYARENEINFQICLDLGKMQNVHMSFPNLRKLSLRMSALETCGLKYLFMEMKQLVSLKIVLTGVNASELRPDSWDSLLTGAPIEFITGLRAVPTFWGNVHIETSDIPSIKMLTDLTALHLGTQSSSPSQLNSQESMISDLTFHFALLKMPKLRRLYLSGRFLASELITQKWRDEFRSFNYNPTARF